MAKTSTLHSEMVKENDQATLFNSILFNIDSNIIQF